MKRTDANACYSGRELMNPDGSSSERVIQVPEQINYRKPLKGNVIPCSSVLLRREDALAYPMGHDELHEDYIMWLSILKKYGKVYGINEPLLVSRLSEGGKSRNKFKSAKMQYGVYRHLGFGKAKSLFYFVQYAVNGVLKYY